MTERFDLEKWWVSKYSRHDMPTLQPWLREALTAAENFQREQFDRLIESRVSERTAKLREALATAVAYLDEFEPPPNRPHAGPCTPESGCDASCADAYNYAEFRAGLRALLKSE